MRLVVRYGQQIIGEMPDENGENHPVNIAQFIQASFEQDELKLVLPIHQRMIDIALEENNGRPTEQVLLNYPDAKINALAFELATDSEQLSNLYTQNESTIYKRNAEQEAAELYALVQHVITDYKLELVGAQVKQIMREMQDPELMRDKERYMQVMTQYRDLKDVEKRLSQAHGGRVMM